MPGFGWVLPLVAAASVLLLGALKWTLFSSSGKARQPDGRVVGVIGRMGSGKTLFAVAEMRRRFRAGLRVSSNFKLSFPCTCSRRHKRRYSEGVHAGNCYSRRAELWSPFRGWEELALLRNCVVVLDEAHLYAPAVAGYALSIDARWAISMCRHNSIDLYWITQHESRVTKTLRDLTTEMVLCKRYRFPRRCKAVGWEPEEFRQPRKWMWSKTYRPDRSLRKLYDTHELVLPDGRADAEGLVEKLIARSMLPQP